MEPIAGEAFSNRPVDLSSIPQLRDEDFVSVAPNFLRVSLIGRAIFAVIVLLVAGAVVVFGGDDVNRLIVGGVAGAFLALTAVSVALKVVEVRNIAYQVREHDLSYRNGVLIRRVQTVPFVRVQHARLVQGPIQRLFKIATLRVNSAGPDIAIAGLSSDDASRLRALVVERAGDLIEKP